MTAFTLPVSYTNVDTIIATTPSISSYSNITSAQIALTAGKVQAIIDGKLSLRYTLPFSGGASDLIKTIATDMTAHHLLAARIIANNRMGDEKLLTGLEYAEKILDQLASGEMLLTDSTGTVIAERTDQMQVWTNNIDYSTTMHEGDWADMVQDQDKLDAIADERDI